MTAIRRNPGRISRKSSIGLPASSVSWIDTPVTLPPGRASEATMSLPTGSTATAKTTGIVEVASFKAGTALPTVTITSTLRLANSAAISRNRSERHPRPSDIRLSQFVPEPNQVHLAAGRRQQSNGSMRIVLPRPKIRLSAVSPAEPAQPSTMPTEPPNKLMNSRRLIATPEAPGLGIVAAQTCTGKGPAHVRYGSLADICAAKTGVRLLRIATA